MIVVGCGNKKAEKKTSLPFPTVEVPGLISNEEDRIKYISEHCWDRFLSMESSENTDSSLLNGVKIKEIEQVYSNYIQILSIAGYPQAKKAIAQFYDKIYEIEKKDSSSMVFGKMVELTDLYLYDPNSPFRDEDIFGAFAKKLSNSSFLDSLERERYCRIAQQCALNSVGSPAADFSFSDEKGRSYSLSGIDAEFTIMFFSNPDCSACEGIIYELNANEKLTQMIEQGRFKVINIYIDEDLAAWYKYMPVYPKTWINAYDPNLSVKTEGLYNIRAIPSLYLLDAEKNVILKDAPSEKIYNFIQNI